MLYLLYLFLIIEDLLPIHCSIAPPPFPLLRSNKLANPLGTKTTNALMMLFCLAQIVCFAVINWCEKWPRERQREREKERDWGPSHTHTPTSPESGRASERGGGSTWSQAGFRNIHWTIVALLWRTRTEPRVRARRQQYCCAGSTSKGRRSTLELAPQTFCGFFQRDTRAKTLSVRATQRFADAPAKNQDRKRESERETEVASGEVEPTIRRL